MNKKNIQIIAVVVCFAGAGFVLYNGLHSSAPKPPANAGNLTAIPSGGAAASAVPSALPGASAAAGAAPAASGGAAASPAPMAGTAGGTAGAGEKTVAAASSDKLLPYGETFDVGKVVGKYNFQFGAYQYPVASSSDAGISLTDLIKPEEKSSNLSQTVSSGVGSFPKGAK